MKKIVRTFSALGAFFVVAIVIAGCGGSSNSVGSNDVAVVAGNPISKQAFNHWMYVAEKSNAEEDGSSSIIVPTDPPKFTGCIAQVKAEIPSYANTSSTTLRNDCKELFDALSAQVMEFLVTGYWYQGTGYTDGLTYTAKQEASDYKEAKKETFPTAAALKQFEAETGETIQDIKWRLRVNHFYAKLVTKDAPKMTKAAEEKYYKAHPSSFGTPEQRNIRLIETSSKSSIDKAEAALKSGQSFAAVAKQYSDNTDSKDSGGVITDVEENQEEAAVNKVIFSAPLNKLEGPIHGEFGYYLVEVTKITPAVTDSFAKEQKEIKALLTQQYQTAAEAKVNKAVEKQWKSKTVCGQYYEITYCSNYVAPKTTTSTTPAAGSPATATSSAGEPATATSSAGQTASTSSSASTATGTVASSTSTTK